MVYKVLSNLTSSITLPLAHPASGTMHSSHFKKTLDNNLGSFAHTTPPAWNAFQIFAGLVPTLYSGLYLNINLPFLIILPKIAPLCHLQTPQP